MKIIDDFLPRREFDILKDHMFSTYFPWHYVPFVNSNDNPDDVVSTRYFEHNFYHGGKSEYFHIIRPMLNKLEIDELYRAKANLFPSTEKIYHHAFHVDQMFKHNGAILYMNTCDGGTIFPDGSMVQSVANRCLLFDSSREHASTTCTDAKARVNININYRTDE